MSISSLLVFITDENNKDNIVKQNEDLKMKIFNFKAIWIVKRYTTKSITMNELDIRALWIECLFLLSNFDFFNRGYQAYLQS